MLKKYVKSRIEMFFERRDSLGGRHLSKGNVYLSPEGWWNRELRFYIKARDSVLNGISGWGEFFPSSRVDWIDDYVRLRGTNNEKDVVLDAVIFPLSMDDHHGFHLNGYYGYKTVTPISMHSLPHPEMIEGEEEGDHISQDIDNLTVSREVVSVQTAEAGSFNRMFTHVEASGGGDYSDPNSTVTGSSWKPGS